MKYFEAVVHKISYVVFQIARVSLILMAILTTVDVIGRYVFNSPILGAQDISELLIVILIFGAMGWATHQRAHIRADILNSALSKRKYAIFSAVGFIAALIISILFAWQSLVSSINSMKAFNQVTFTIGIHTAPFQLFTAICLIILCLELFIDIWHYINEAKTS